MADHTESRPFSLRLRLTLFVAIILAIALGLVGVALNAAHERSVIASLQTRLESYVYLVLAAVEIAPDGNIVIVDEFGDPRLNQPESGIYAQVETPEDRWRSPSAVALEMPDLPQAASGEMHFTEPGSVLFQEPSQDVWFVQQMGVNWQFGDGFTVPVTVSVLAHPDEANQHTEAFAAGLLRSLGTAGVILVLAMLVIFFFGYRPLRRVANEVELIETGRADRLEGHYPRELELLTRNVNRLLTTEKANQERYRNALDSLAHSLKTPLAVITAGLELQGNDNINSMKKAANDIEHLIGTRLQRARGSARRTLAEPIGVRPACDRVIQSLQKVYSHKMIETAVTLPAELEFFGEERDLLELMGNLLDNAFKFGNGKVKVIGGGDQTRHKAPRFLAENRG